MDEICVLYAIKQKSFLCDVEDKDNTIDVFFSYRTVGFNYALVGLQLE